MKGLHLFTAMAAFVGLFLACGDQGTGIDNREPLLSVNAETIELTGTPQYDIIRLTNAGGNLLEWSIVEWPQWMDISTYAGKVIKDTLALRLTTHFDKLEYGAYEGTIKFTSNGGDLSVLVKLVYTAPEMKIDMPVINLDRHYRYSELEIQNIGGGELTWQINQTPSWLQFEMINGSVFGRPERIPFRARLSTLDYGVYEDKVTISSNGGDHEVQVFLTFEREVEIYPGVGAANIELEDTYTMVQNRLGKPDHNWYDRPEKTVFIHHFTYDDLGLHFAVKNNSMILYGSGQVGYIEIYAPYDGMTQELLGIGSGGDEWKAIYGPPAEINGDQWVYTSGIICVVQGGKISRFIIKSSQF
ncbi:MAG: hypothetical protein EHM72_16095 [Calditrichaeota bacterium]|nr:MAG: hypothetical protein EHM72_16095 [Calditrichota bacterium]